VLDLVGEKGGVGGGQERRFVSFRIVIHFCNLYISAPFVSLYSSLQKPTHLGQAEDVAQGLHRRRRVVRAPLEGRICGGRAEDQSGQEDARGVEVEEECLISVDLDGGVMDSVSGTGSTQRVESIRP
jgi:hypothetical protein